MDVNSHNGNGEFVQSRFSEEERAKIAEENARNRAARKREESAYEKPTTVNDNRKATSTEKKKKTAVKEVQNGKKTDAKSSRKKSTASTKSQKNKNTHEAFKGSRNDKVRTSTQQRKKNKKRQNFIITVALCVIVVSLIAVLLITMLRINSIQVVDCERYSAEEVINQSTLKKGGSMLLISKNKICEKLREDLPYISQAKISRAWPDTIVITVEEAVAELAIDTGSGYILLDSSCKVLDASADFLVETAAPLVGVTPVKYVAGQTIQFAEELDEETTQDESTTAEEATSEQTTQAKRDKISTEDISKLLQALKDSGIEKVTYLDLTDISDVILVLNHRIEIKLGTLSKANERLLKFAERVIEETEKDDMSHEILIDLTSDKEARVRVKNSNEVSFDYSTEEAERYG